MIKNILVTGSNGQLGSELSKLFDSYPQFHFFPTDIDTLDLCNRTEVKNFVEKNDIAYIVNCAAYTAVDKAEDEVEISYKVNRDAVENLGLVANGQAKVIHVSTDYVFDGRGDLPYKETNQTNPQSVYGKSKREGEEILLKTCPDSIIIRTAWLYSTFGNNFVKTMIRLGKERESLNVVADQIGTPTCAEDLARAIMHIIDWSEKQNKFESGIYHYSNEGICSWYDFTVKIFETENITCKVNPITTKKYPTKAARPAYSVLDKTKIKTTFQLTIPQWEDSLKKTLESMK